VVFRRLDAILNAGRPLHLHISLIFGSLFLVLALILIAFAYATGRATALSQASTLVDARLDNLISRSVGQLTEVEAVIAALASNPKLMVSGRGDPTGKFAVLRDTLSHLPVVDGLSVGYPNGDFAHLVSLERQAWRRALAAPAAAAFAFRIISISPNSTRSSVWSFFTQDGLYLSQTEPRGANYDPRLRPWFMLAKANSGMVWTPAYVFATTRQIGFTISSTMRDMPGAVVAADITLEHLGRMFEEHKITRSTRVMLFDNKGGLLAFSKDPDRGKIATSRDAVMQEVYRRATDPRSIATESFSLDFDGDTYIVTVKSARASPNQQVFMSMITPVREVTRALP
jgi:adenylate cyclase